jgi:hypothetical protein
MVAAPICWRDNRLRSDPCNRNLIALIARADRTPGSITLSLDTEAPAVCLKTDAEHIDTDRLHSSDLDRHHVSLVSIAAFTFQAGFRQLFLVPEANDYSLGQFSTFASGDAIIGYGDPIVVPAQPTPQNGI